MEGVGAVCSLTHTRVAHVSPAFLPLCQDEFSKFVRGVSEAVFLVGISASRPPSATLTALIKIVFEVRSHVALPHPPRWIRAALVACVNTASP